MEPRCWLPATRTPASGAAYDHWRGRKQQAAHLPLLLVQARREDCILLPRPPAALPLPSAARVSAPPTCPGRRGVASHYACDRPSSTTSRACCLPALCER